MKVNELADQHQPLNLVKVLIPQDIPDIELNLIGLDSRAVYATSGWDYTDEGGAAGTWCKKDPGEQGRAFPVPCRPRDILNWEVIDANTVIPEVDPNAQYSPGQVKKERAGWWRTMFRKWEGEKDLQAAVDPIEV